MTITKLFPSGALEVTDIIDGHLVRHTYYGYTIKVAARLFRQQYNPKKKGTK